MRFVNLGDLAMLLLDGEELIGAKQNRILNLSILAPAHQTIAIPVSCVEVGRWHAQSAEFGSARRTQFAAGRARKAADVSESLAGAAPARAIRARCGATSRSTCAPSGPRPTLTAARPRPPRAANGWDSHWTLIAG